MDINITLTEADLRAMLKARFVELLPSIDIEDHNVNILVKSAQNYRAEWESAQIKATITKSS